MQRAVEVLPRLVDPNRELPAASHAHGHGHDHRDEPGHGPQEPPGDRAARAAKDRPGRHNEGYYGAPGPGPSRRAATDQGQGSRSFAALTRRRPG
jgi:hypothetical protein